MVAVFVSAVVLGIVSKQAFAVRGLFLSQEIRTRLPVIFTDIAQKTGIGASQFTIQDSSCSRNLCSVTIQRSYRTPNVNIAPTTHVVSWTSGTSTYDISPTLP